jgi:hypothetical protein
MFPARQSPPGRYRRAVLSLVVAAALVAAGAGFVTRGRAADPAPADDVALARAALAELDADPALKDFNLVVSVVDRVVVVGGPVATTAQKDRAAELVRRVPGVRDVRNGCFVQAGAEPLLKSNLAAARPLPVLPPVVIPLRPSSTAETAPPTADLVAVAPVERSVVTRRPTNPGENFLEAPVASQPGPPAAVSPYPPGVLTTRPAFADSVETARRSDARFAGLRAEFRDGGTVVITGTAPRASDAWDFAELVRGVPGVVRVAVGPVGR